MAWTPGTLGRRSIRLRGWNYASAGIYFLTVCTWRRWKLFGRYELGHYRLLGWGEMVRQAVLALPRHYPHARIDRLAILPDHVHLLLELGRLELPRGEPLAPVSELVRAFKSFSARAINASRRTPGRPVWQRNYYEQIVRGDDALRNMRRYVTNNVERHRPRAGA